MFMKLLMGILFFALACMPVSSLAAAQPLVAFLNPGGEGDPFFQPMTDFMQAAANDLGFELVVSYSDRSHAFVQYAEDVELLFRKERKPDYIIGMNPRGAGVELLEQAEEAGVDVILINQSFLGEARAKVGVPGEKYKHWIMEYVPDDVHSGYLLAKTLIREARDAGRFSRDGYIDVVALNGHKMSFASILRAQGLKQAIAEESIVRLRQLIHANWKKDRAHDLTLGLLERYPDVSVVWAASDVMAAGVVDAVKGAGKQPGKDVLTGGVDWAAIGLDNVRKGDCMATVGGHFMDGGWALVMLYDRIHGVDVPKMGRSKFSSLTRDNVDRYMTLFGEDGWEKIDFTRFSKHLNPKQKEYDFGLNALLEQVQ